MNHDFIKGIKVGDVITAKLLNQISVSVNANSRAINAPKQKTQLDELAKPGGSGGGSINVSEVFNSTSGTETTVTITDDGGNDHDIERVDTIVFEEQTSGRTMTLNITYPL